MSENLGHTELFFSDLSKAANLDRYIPVINAVLSEMKEVSSEVNDLRMRKTVASD